MEMPNVCTEHFAITDCPSSITRGRAMQPHYTGAFNTIDIATKAIDTY